MGCAGSKPQGGQAPNQPATQAPNDKDQDVKIDNVLSNKRQLDEKIFKLLLLGAGESGKSTLFKQAVSLYGKGVSQEDLKALTTPIHNNIFFCMIALCANVDKWAEVQPQNQEAYLFFKSSSSTDDTILTTDQFTYVEQLWADPAIKTCWEHRNEFQIYDCAEYFFNKIAEIAQPNYQPTQDDHLRIRVRTTGIVETVFSIEGTQFKLCDVGGQRNERKKWIHCFDNVTAVIFVAAISEYNQVLFEDSQTNRLDEALLLFEDIAGSKYFEKQSLILFLNKSDLFVEKITRIPLREFFPEYTGPDGDIEAAQSWLRDQFLSRLPPNRMAYTHITCATSQQSTQQVLAAVKETVISQALEVLGMH